MLKEPLVRDFVDFARWRLVTAFGLVAGGVLLEGAGILLLVPALGLALGELSGAGAAASYADPFFDLVGAETGEERLLALLAVFLVVIGLRFALLLKRDMTLTALRKDFVVRLRSRAFRSLAAKPWAELARLQHADVGHALLRDVDRAELGVGVVIGGATSMLVLVVQLGLATALSPALTLLAVVIGAVGFLALRRLRARAAELGRQFSSRDRAFYSSTQQFLSGLKPAKAHRMEGDYTEAFERALRERRAQSMAWMLDQTLARLILQSGAAVAGALAVLAGVFWLDLSTEVMIVTVLILARVYGPVMALQSLVQGVRHASAGYRVARELSEGSLAGPEAPTAAPPAPLDYAPELALEGVTIRSDEQGRAPILDGVTCRIPAGQVTVLVGPSGAGKSMLCDLAVGLLRPDGGRVLMDGAPLDEAASARLGASLAYVGQEPFMLGQSLRDNLGWGTRGLPDTDLHDALDLVGARRMADELEGGLDGWVRAEGTRFSGGERQRLRIARAWLRRPRLMVLDEATNALDPEAEQRLLDQLFAARNGATVLMITHRPAAALRADHVILLERGRVAATGQPEVLADLPNGAFGSLFAPTLAGEPPADDLSRTGPGSRA